MIAAGGRFTTLLPSDAEKPAHILRHQPVHDDTESHNLNRRSE